MNIDIHAHFVPPDSLKVAGAEHVLLGSDDPYDMGDPQPVKSLGQTKIAGNELELISGANACQLFGIGL